MRCSVVRVSMIWGGGGGGNQLYTWYTERTSALVSKIRAMGRPSNTPDLMASFLLSNSTPTSWHLFFFQTPVPRSQLPVSRFRLLDIVENSHKMGTSTTLNAVAKENIHVRAKVLVNLKLIGSCITGSQPKHVFHKGRRLRR